jgi:hypothetical protein
MPSVADLIFVALLATLVFMPLSVKLLGDAGIGWHIRAGQQILATHAVPRVDPFSSSMAGQPWFAWEWLFDMVVGELDAKLGLNGVVWLTATVIAAVFALLFRLLMQRGVNLCIALGMTLLTLGASMIHFLARPHVVSWLITLIWFFILNTTERDSVSGRDRSTRWLWTLPLLMLVWVNIHGGFLIGFVLLVIFWLGAVWDWFTAKEDRIEQALQKIAAGKRILNLLWIGLASLAASLANPYGWKLHRHIYSYLSNHFLMDHIEEFQSPNFHGIAQKCFAILLLITLAVLAVRSRQLRASGVLTVLFATYTGLYASRNIPVSSILLVIVIVPLMHSAMPRQEGLFQRMQQMESRLHGHLWPIAAIVLTFGIAANGGHVGSSTLMDAHFDPRRMPVEAANYLEQHSVRGPILSPDYWGGYLIYRLSPSQKVVVDDRHDFYGEAFLKSYLKMLHVERGWQDFLNEHEASCILLPRDAALANVLIETREWKPIYSDELAIAFVRIPSAEEKEIHSPNNLSHKSAPARLLALDITSGLPVTTKRSQVVVGVSQVW